MLKDIDIVVQTFVSSKYGISYNNIQRENNIGFTCSVE